MLDQNVGLIVFSCFFFKEVISFVGCKDDDNRNVAWNRSKGGHGALLVLHFLMATSSTNQVGEFA